MVEEFEDLKGFVNNLIPTGFPSNFCLRRRSAGHKSLLRGQPALAGLFHLLTVRERALKGALVRVFDIPANGQTARQAGDFNPHLADALLQVESCRVAFH